MAKSRTELATFVLRDLLVLGAGETASAEDITVVDDMIDSVCSGLESRNIYASGSLEEFELDAFVPLGKVLAQHCASSFNRAPKFDVVQFYEAQLETIAKGNKGSGQRLKVDPALTRSFGWRRR